jgi:hypothetical protein
MRGARPRACLVALQQVGWHGVLGGAVVCFVLVLPLLVHGDGLLHLRLLLVALLGKHLALEPDGLLRILGPLVHLARLLLALALCMVQLPAIPLPMQLYVLVLRHACAGGGLAAPLGPAGCVLLAG